MQFTQYKKLQKYYLGSPVIPAEYKKGDINMIGDFDSLESCQSGGITVVYWVYPKGETELYAGRSGFTFTLDHSDANYDYYVINGSGDGLSFSETNLISGGTADFSNMNKRSGWNGMFQDCISLTSLDASGWVTNSPTYMYQTFEGCTSLTSLDVSGWVMSSVGNAQSMFDGCSSLAEIIGIENWNMSGASNLNAMFYGCSSLISLDLSGWNISSVINLNSMFENCTSLETLNLSNWNVTSISDNINGIFSNCSSLTTLYLDGWELNTTYNNLLFNRCSSLRTIYMRGCSSSTIQKIESNLNYYGFLDNVTIVTE